MTKLADTRTRTEEASAASTPHPLLDARGVSHRYGEGFALQDVSFAIAPGEIHALLGPNGAGKTTLIRILAGLLTPRRGSVEIGGLPASSNARLYRQQIGFVASGDRTFYLRISGLENLVFFARLHGIRRRQAIPRALEVLAGVGLEDVARRPVGEYSHGMQKRLSIARALLTSPPVLLIDEATHDLDPEGARRVRELIAAEASRGAAVAWVTQRLDEIRGFADSVTLVGAGRVRFAGTVPQLLSHVTPRRFLLHLDGHRLAVPVESLGAALAPGSTLVRMGAEDPEHYLLSLAEDSVLGDALASLTSAGVQVLSCREERSEIEQAFLLLLDGDDG